MKSFRYLFEDSVDITAEPEKVYAFFESMAENYCLWHPDHLSFEWRKGRGLAEGVEFHFAERIAGKRLNKTTRFTRIVPNRYIEFTMTNPIYRWFIPKMTFIIEPTRQGCRFTGQVFLRGVGPIGRALHYKEFEAVAQHMREEGQNLKRIVEGT